MKRSTIFHNRLIQRAGAIALALLFWQILALLVGQSFLLPSPFSVAQRLFGIWLEPGFWPTVWHSFWRIVLGFLIALVCGLVFGSLAGRFSVLEILLEPFALMVRSVPVASFIVIFLIWLSSDRLSIFIPFLMTLPVVYTNVLQGVKSVDTQLRECVQVFHLSLSRRIRYLWLPQLKPFLHSACGVGLGLSWKSGIAAEIIGIPSGSIGRMFYDAKIYLNTTELFAWTVIVVLVSVLFEKLFLSLLNMGYRRFVYD